MAFDLDLEDDRDHEQQWWTPEEDEHLDEDLEDDGDHQDDWLEDDEPQQPETDTLSVATAFLVTIDLNGEVHVYDDIPGPVDALHKASQAHVRSACAEVLRSLDLQDQATALGKVLGAHNTVVHNHVTPTVADSVASALRERGISPRG